MKYRGLSNKSSNGRSRDRQVQGDGKNGLDEFFRPNQEGDEWIERNKWQVKAQQVWVSCSKPGGAAVVLGF
jgi:hypothetical protein